MTLAVILGYIGLLLVLGAWSARFLRRTAGDYFLASRGIGPFMLLMSIFGTTMTAFALIGSTGETFKKGIGIYGLMASWSGIVHPACFFLIGARVWALGKRHGYLTQIGFFRDRYRSDALALLLFAVMVVFVTIYILMGIIGSGRIIEAVTPETFALPAARTAVPLDQLPGDLEIPAAWVGRLSYDETRRELVLLGSLAPEREAEIAALSRGADPAFTRAAAELARTAPRGAVPYWAASGFICLVVLFYVFTGGMRATAWANTLQTLVFIGMGLAAFIVIMKALGGPAQASENLLRSNEETARKLVREGNFGQIEFLTYAFIPLSVGMFPHLYQHWLTARRASGFKLTIAAFPVCILLTWLPCVLIGMWAAAVLPHDTDPNSVLGIMIARHSGDFLTGLIGAGILAAIMSSLDSQFLCLGSLFTNDIVVRYLGEERVPERRRVLLGRIFVSAVVLATYLIAMLHPARVFPIGVWCFTGFSGLTPIAFAALYWKRSNKHGAIAAVIAVTALWLALLPRALAKDADAGFLILGAVPAVFITAVSAAALFLVTLLTPPPDRATVEKFFPGRG